MLCIMIHRPSAMLSAEVYSSRECYSIGILPKVGNISRASYLLLETLYQFTIFCKLLFSSGQKKLKHIPFFDDVQQN